MKHTKFYSTQPKRTDNSGLAQCASAPLIRDHSAESWNNLYPVGTAVRYWPMLPAIHSAPPVETTTRSEAWTLGDGCAVVAVMGKAGGVCLSHIEIRHE